MRIEKDPFLIEDGQYIAITVSIEVSTYREEVKDTSTMVSNTDNALYTAKENGGNQVRAFEKRV